MTFDHILLIGYGAPSNPEEVAPYLRAMSEGRNVSDDRLKIVTKHYEMIGGASPYQGQVSDFKVRLERELHSSGISLPVFIGMKNWHPFLRDSLSEIHRRGFRNGLALPLTPYRAASWGAGYQKLLESLCASSGRRGLGYRFIEGWFSCKPFIEAEAEEISETLRGVADRFTTPILFSFHALPDKKDPSDPVSRLGEEANAAGALVAECLRHSKWTVVYQSRPVSSQGVWSQPEIEAEVKALAAKGEKRVLIVPLGFLCDHAEILYDLDDEIRGVVEGFGMEYLRCRTVYHSPKIVNLFKTLIENAMNGALRA